MNSGIFCNKALKIINILNAGWCKERDEVEDLLKKIKEILVMISNKKGGERLVATTQLWFLPFTNNFKISETLRTMMENDEYFGQYEIVINKEPENTTNPNRHPPPLVKQERKLGQLISHYQTRTVSQRKKGMIFLLDPKVDMSGLSLTNVDIVFSLNDEKNPMLSYLMFSKCMTPIQGKNSVFFVDFNVDRILQLIKKEFGNQANILAKKLVYLLDIDEPQMNSSQVIQTLIMKHQNVNVKNIIDQSQEHDVQYTKTMINSKKIQNKLASSSMMEPKTQQQWIQKWQNDRKYFTSFNKYESLAKAVGIDIQYPENMTSTVKKRNYVRSVLQQKQKQLGSIRSATTL